MKKKNHTEESITARTAWVLFVIAVLSTTQIYAQNKQGKWLARSVISNVGTLGIDHKNSDFKIQHALGQNSPIGLANTTNYAVRQGFIQPISGENIIQILPTFRFQAYPNPFADFINISFNNSLQTNADVAVFDMQSKQVYSKTFIKGQEEIRLDLSHFPTGTYMLHIKANNQSYTKTLLKK